MKKIFLILSPVILFAGLYFLFYTPEIKHTPGILVNTNPIQTNLKDPIIWEKDNYSFTAIAEFNIELRVLSIKSYRSDEMSSFSPLDIAAGWSKMSDQSILDKISIKQQHRWYVWNVQQFPIPQKEIELNSTNIHIIPANNNVNSLLEKIIKGNILKLRGYLVNVKSNKNKRTWKTSTKRNDTGSGACEILWTEEVLILK